MSNIISTIKEHLAILEVLVPFFSSLLTVICCNRRLALWIARLCAVIGIVLGGYGVFIAINNTGPSFYAIGDWVRPIGIEYRIDRLNQMIIIFNNILLLILLTLNFDLVNRSLLTPLNKNVENLFYCTLLLLHTGFCGIVMSNDLFNIYVFIEITSLASYTLLAQGNDKRALIASINYLIIGTIGATLILLAIGFMFSITGSLNINDVVVRLPIQSTHTLIGAIIFYIVGCLLKLAVFPISAWVLQSYRYTSSVILSYFAPISGIVGFYILLYFVYHIIGISYIQNLKAYCFLNIICMVGTVIPSYYATKQISIKSIIAHSIVAEIGYISLAIFNIQDYIVGTQIIIAVLASGIIKSIMYSLISRLETHHHDYNLEHLNSLGIKYPIFGALFTVSLISNLGLPITIGFINKLNITLALFSSLGYLSLIILAINNGLSFIYHYKIFHHLYYVQPTNNSIEIIGNNQSATQLTISSYLLLIFFHWLVLYLKDFLIYKIT